MEFDLSNTVDLCQICYVSYGLRLNADERYWRGEFQKKDLLSEKKDKIHSKEFIEAKYIDRYVIKKVLFVEWQSDRVPDKLVRPTFPGLYKGEKILLARVVEEKPKAMLDLADLVCDNTIIVATPWRNLESINNASIIRELTRIKEEYGLKNNFDSIRSDLNSNSGRFSLKYLLAIINSTFAINFLKSIRRGKFDIYPGDYKKIPIKVVSLKIQQKIVKLVDMLIKINNELKDIESLSNRLEELIEKFKSIFPRYSEIQLVPLADIPGLKHIQLEKRLGKPDIRREGTRVYLAKNHYLDLTNEPLAEYIELALTSMQDNLRGLTKPDILRMVEVPKEDKTLRDILKYNSDLKKQKYRLEQQLDAIDREIDERVYELYRITQEERRLIEGT